MLAIDMCVTTRDSRITRDEMVRAAGFFFHWCTDSHLAVHGSLVTTFLRYILDNLPSFTMESANDEVDRQHLSPNISKSISLFFHRFLLEYVEVVVPAANHVKVVTGYLGDIIEILFRLTQTCFSAASAGIASTASKIDIV